MSTLRWGGYSDAPYDSFNLAEHTGDVPERVTKNRQQLLQSLPASTEIQWLRQVHGTQVVEAVGCNYPASGDACFSRRPGIACAILTADCLPVLLCSLRGDVVAAAHAGWRGLAAGILEAVVSRMDTPADQILAWLGPAIGPGTFEVGPEVRERFVDEAGPHRISVAASFVVSQDRPGHYLADLYALARQRLAALGVARVYGGGECTVTDSQRYFSYRRDGRTGRMASLIMLQ